LTLSCPRASIILVGANTTFSSNGRRILTSSLDGTVRVFTCDVRGRIEDLVALAEARLAGVPWALPPAEGRPYSGPGG
jgi:WD40 repeat protein